MPLLFPSSYHTSSPRKFQDTGTDCRLRLKCDGTRAETISRLLAKRTSPFKSAGASVQSTTGSRGVRISGSNAGCIMFRGSMKSTDYSLHSQVSPSLPLSCVTVCHHISTGLYLQSHGSAARNVFFFFLKSVVVHNVITDYTCVKFVGCNLKDRRSYN